MAACEKHRTEPVKGYQECPGCEVEALRSEVAKLKSEVEVQAYWGDRWVRQHEECERLRADLDAALRRMAEYEEGMRMAREHLSAAFKVRMGAESVLEHIQRAFRVWPKPANAGSNGPSGVAAKVRVD